MKHLCRSLLLSFLLSFPASIGWGLEFASIDDQLVDPQALTLPSNVTFGNWINGRSYQQDLLITHADRQYAAYYNKDRHVCVARRSLPSGPWEIVVLEDYTMTSVDSHNVVSLGIAPGDGTLHLSFDHHVSNLHYRRSVPGALWAETWEAALFEPVRNWLLSENNPISGVTYPRFATSPDGNLVFSYRNGYPENGHRPIHRYTAATGSWSGRTRIINKDGEFSDEFGSSNSRSGYLNPLRYTPDGRLHATWVWREEGNTSAGSKDNHDLMYLYSDDNGVTWYTGDGTFVDGKDGVTVGTPGVTAVSIPRGLGLINSNAQTVDDQGRVHVVLRHCTDESLAAAGYERGEVAFGPVAARRLHHYWRDLDNSWHHTELPATPGSRSAALFADHQGNLVFVHQVSRNLEILEATIQNQFQDWKIVQSYRINSNLDILADPVRWKRDGVLSIPYQLIPAVWGEPSAFRVVDFVKVSEPQILPSYYSYTVPVQADAFVRNNGTQDGRGTTVMVKNLSNDEFDRMTYLKFDSPRTRNPVYRARLRMRVNISTGPVDVSVYAVNDDAWTEDSLTWANAPGFGPLLATRTVGPEEPWVEWDVTQALVNSPDSLITLALWVDTPVNVDLTFRSREFGDGSDGPVLLIQSATPYSEWADGHHENAEMLAPDADANSDGVPNLLAFGMGLHSPLTTATTLPVEFIWVDSQWMVAARRSQAAALYHPGFVQSTSLAAANWVEVPQPIVDTDFFAPGIDRIRVPVQAANAFFRYRIGP